MLAYSMLAMGAAAVVAGNTSSMIVFVIARMLFAIACAAANAPLFGIVSNNFAPERRATANSIMLAGIPLGNAIASLSILLLKKSGWRSVYFYLAGAYTSLGALAMLILKNGRTSE